jgi:hypothetical protein
MTRPSIALLLSVVALSRGAAQNPVAAVQATDTVRVWAPGLSLNGAQGRIGARSADTVSFYPLSPYGGFSQATRIATQQITQLDIREGTVRSGQRAFAGAAIGIVVGALVVGGLESSTSHSGSGPGYDSWSQGISTGVAAFIGGLVGGIAGAVIGNQPVARWRRVYP